MKSIRTNLMLPMLAGIVLLSTGAATLLYFSMRHAMVLQFDEALNDKAAALASLVQVVSNGKLEFDYSDENFAEFRRDKRPEFFQIRLADGKSLERSVTLKNKNLPLLKSDDPAADNRLAPAVCAAITLPNGQEGRMLSVVRQALVDEDNDNPGARSAATTQEARTLPFVTISVARDTLDIDRTLARLRRALVIGVLALGGCVAVLVPLVIRRGLRPLQTIAEHAELINLHSLDRAFPSKNLPLELLPISARLNELLNRLSDAFARETRFSANAAHELRTPIAEIRAVTEVALHWPESRQGQRALEDVVDVSSRMQTLVETLLKLARARAGEIDLLPTAFSPFELAQKTIQAHSQIIQQNRLSIRLERPSGPKALADAPLSGALIGNLVANAVHHSPSHASILINEISAESWVELVIVNDCAPGTLADAALLCEPFWTASASRTDQRHGLGLALVREYAKLLDTPLTFAVIDGKQFRVTVRFKAAPSNAAAPAQTSARDAAVLEPKS